jgi:hypothetical protein
VPDRRSRDRRRWRGSTAPTPGSDDRAAYLDELAPDTLPVGAYVAGELLHVFLADEVNS